jgi:mannosyltransferase
MQVGVSTPAPVDDLARHAAPGERERRWQRDPAVWTIGAATAAALGLGLYRLGELSLWFDEVVSERVTGSAWSDLFSYIREREPNYGLYYTGLKVWGGLVGRSEAVLRFPSAVAFAATVPVAAALSWRAAGRRAAVIAAVLLAAHATLLRWGQDMRPYALMAFLVTLSALLLLRASERPTAERWLAWVTVATLACYSHSFGAVAVAAQLAVFLVSDRRRRDLLVATGVVAAVTLPLVILMYRSGSDRIAWIPSPGRDELGWALHATTGGGSTLLALGYGAAALGGTAFGRLRPPFRPLLAGWYGGPVLFALVVSLRQPLVQDRYFLVCAPALVIAAAAGLARLRPAGIAVVGVAVLIALSLFEIGDWYSGNGKENWRAAAAVVATDDVTGDAVLVADSPLPFARYYLETLQPRARVVGPHYRPVERTADAARLWLVLRGESGMTDRLREIATDGGRAKVGRWEVSHLQVELYAR